MYDWNETNMLQTFLSLLCLFTLRSYISYRWNTNENTWRLKGKAINSSPTTCGGICVIISVLGMTNAWYVLQWIVVFYTLLICTLYGTAYRWVFHAAFEPFYPLILLCHITIAVTINIIIIIIQSLKLVTTTKLYKFVLQLTCVKGSNYVCIGSWYFCLLVCMCGRKLHDLHIHFGTTVQKIHSMSSMGSAFHEYTQTHFTHIYWRLTYKTQ